ncbi:phosphopantetheine-binding protein [Nonomuraea jabiensis]|uniref:Dihydroaeruginoic acid synthetase/nonribosomal peptide synthetase protein BlmIV n=1 Tax=Nonomuraea jabiensis TaxID=882448 RepID=A0A7W9GDB8_9ACTN|nr:phosphopantetheine-binding protein [Nonomuraea jabiensis]MBB5781621.1 dihydroaeruginoic acid synthetase/nonribosomal peptide synthetase protein BlmIV [Nonomuraea jabiensis]
MTADLEPALRRIWADVLDLPEERIASGDSFLALGGDSVLAVRTAALVRRRLGVVLAMSDLRVQDTLADLAAAVRERGSARDGDVPDLKPVRRDDPLAPFPLLPLQQGYFVGQQDGWELSYESAHHYVDFGLTGVDGDEAAEALRDALHRLAEHQPALRARILPDGTQRILDPDAPGAIPSPTVHDWRALDAGEAARLLAGLRADMRANGPDPATGPGVDLRLSLMPDGRGRLHSSMSLLLVDGWSSGVFYRDLLAFAADWNTVLAPLDIDFGDYVTAVQGLPETPQWQADRDWWWERLDAFPQPPALPVTAEPDTVRARVMRSLETRLAPDRWARVQELCREHGVTPSAAALAAYAVALARTAGHRRFLLNSLQLNRLPLHPDVHRMVGAFSSTVLLPIELPEHRTFADLARELQTLTGEALAHNLVTGVEVSRELARRWGTTRPVAPVVFQSTLGVDAAMGSSVPEEAGPLGHIDLTDHRQELRTPQVAMEGRLYEARDELVIVLSLVEELFHAQDVEGLFTTFTTLVRSLDTPDGWERTCDLPERLDADGGLRLDARPRASIAQDGGPLRDELEQAVADCWSELLDLPEDRQLDRAAEFFALGGDSLAAIRMLTRLARSGLPHVTPRDFLAAPTVAGLAAAIREKRGPEG